MKKHRVNRIMTFILVLALSVSTLLIGCGKNNDKIVLGWIGPLTGENTIWGTAEMQALTMAVEDTNAAGGLLGKEVELKTYDNRGDAVETTNAAKKAIQQDGCIALFGCNTSACAIALSEVCTQFNIPHSTHLYLPRLPLRSPNGRCHGAVCLQGDGASFCCDYL